MRSLRSTRFAVLALVPHALALLTTGCGSASDDLGQSNDELRVVGTDFDPPIATKPVIDVPPPIVHGTLTTVPNWVVMIDIDHPATNKTTTCSAWVLNEHWLLTAAHCLVSATDGEIVHVSRADRIASLVEIYRAPGKYFHNPLFANSTPHDVGLVHLDNQGLRIDQTGVAKMYSDTRRPWADASLPRDISAVGWGFATPDPNDPTGCTGGGGALRTTDSMSVDVSSATTSVVTSPIGASFPCTGDSGAPWLLQRGDATQGMDFFGFAVHSRRTGSPTKGQAAPLDDNRTWIENTISSASATDKYGAFCSESDFAGFRFRKCEMISRGWAQLKALGKCMQVTSPTPGSSVTMVTCNQSVMAQVWSLIPTGEIKNALAPNLCLETLPATTGNALPHVATCNNSSTQRFGNGAQGQLKLGFDFQQCVTAVPDPVATTGTAGSNAPPWTTNVATFSVSSAATLAAPTAGPVVANIVPCVTIACLPKVVVTACDGGFAQSWAWGTF